MGEQSAAIHHHSRAQQRYCDSLMSGLGRQASMGMNNSLLGDGMQSGLTTDSMRMGASRMVGRDGWQFEGEGEASGAGAAMGSLSMGHGFSH